MFEVKDYEASKLFVARKCSYSFCVQMLTVVLVAILAAGLLIPGAFAGGCCGGGTWDPYAFLNSDVSGAQAAKTSSSNQAPASNSAQSATQPIATKPAQRSNLFPNG